MNGSDDNITVFPRYNLYNIPEALRKVANEIEENPALCKKILLCGQNTNGGVWYKAFGEDFPKMHAVGILEYAKAEIMDLFKK